MSADLNKVRESLVSIRSRCTRVMSSLVNNNFMVNRWFYSELEHILLVCDTADDRVRRLGEKEKVSGLPGVLIVVIVVYVDDLLLVQAQVVVFQVAVLCWSCFCL